MTEKEIEQPKGISVLSILYIIGGIFWLIYPIFYMYWLGVYYKEIEGYIPWASWMFNSVCCWIGSIIIAGLYFGIAAGLKKGMPGAWVWAIIFAIIGLFNVPIGTIISIIILIYLFTPNVRKWFEQGAKKQQKEMEKMQKEQKFQQMQEEEKKRKEYEEFQEYLKQKKEKEKQNKQ